MWILKWLSDIAVVKQQEQQEFLLRSFPYGVCCISFYCFCFCFNQAGVYDSNNVIQISNYYNWPWWWVSLAFTTVCLIPEDGQLYHNAHFIEIIVLIMALRIHHFVSICRPVCGNTTFRRSEMWRAPGLIKWAHIQKASRWSCHPVFSHPLHSVIQQKGPGMLHAVW